MPQPDPPIEIDLDAERATSSATHPGNVKGQHMTTRWTITFEFAFDVEHQLTRDEFVNLAREAIGEMKKQFPEHIQNYPQEFLNELRKQNMLRLETFAGNGAGGGQRG